MHHGLPACLSFFRDRAGAEVDVLVELARTVLAVETKSGQTVAADFFSGLDAFRSLAAASRPRREVRGFVVYGGTEAQQRSAGTVVPWSMLDRHAWSEAGEGEVLKTELREPMTRFTSSQAAPRKNKRGARSRSRAARSAAEGRGARTAHRRSR